MLNVGTCQRGVLVRFRELSLGCSEELAVRGWHEFLLPFHDAKTCLQGSMLGCALTGANLATGGVAGGLYHAGAGLLGMGKGMLAPCGKTAARH
jgi:hypothetical protein